MANKIEKQMARDAKLEEILRKLDLILKALKIDDRKED
jgi:hypothetical protein